MNLKKNILFIILWILGVSLFIVSAWTFILSDFFDSEEIDSSSVSDSSNSEEIELPSESAKEHAPFKAMWISYLELENADFSSEENFASYMSVMFDNCKNLGLNTVIVQVRPFADALYKSEVYPSSNFVTGVQGGEIPFDPLAVMTQLAHSKDLRIEAWINPYRVKLNEKYPGVQLAENNIANTHPEYIKKVNGGFYLNPALEEVKTLVSEGVAEIVMNYDVDGIHFDDYFYPDIATSFDEEDYQNANTDMELSDWRCENVSSLIAKVYSTIKAIDEDCTFGISPQGNYDNNYVLQYSDVSRWISEEGYVDYLMPQIYWGYDFKTLSGNEDYQFDKLCDMWGDLPRLDSVNMYVGIGAYRIGVGDNASKGNNPDEKPQGEWASGENVAKMCKTIEENENLNGFAFFRYDHLFNNTEYEELAKSERENISKYLN